MFVTDKFVFVELHKTGSEHIRMLLNSIYDGDQIGKHAPAEEHMFTPGRFFFGSIRNPWSWYLSLWAFGCANKGKLFESLTGRNYTLNGRGWKRKPATALVSFYYELLKDNSIWQDCYSNVNDPDKFRQWLRHINDPKYASDLGESYYFHECHKFCGLMSYRYARLFCRGDFSEVSSFPDLKSFIKKSRYIEYFVRNENLESDLVRILHLISNGLSETDVQRIYNSGRTNTATTGLSAAKYWDNESIQLVGEREQIVIEEHDYAPPF